MVCDLAQTYHIYDWQTVPLHTLAVLVSGLPPESRTMRHFSKQKYSTEELILMRIFDSVNFIAWAQTKDAQRGANRPESLYDMATKPRKDDKKPKAFATAADFEAALKKARGKG